MLKFYKSFFLTKLLLVCGMFFIMNAYSFSQSQREYTFKGGLLVRVNEGCSYTLSATSKTAGIGATTGTLSVATTGGCAWTASSNQSWLSITSAKTGSGNGVINYSIAANTGEARAGVITIAGLTFTVSQDGTNSCAPKCEQANQTCLYQAAQAAATCQSACGQAAIQQNPACMANPSLCAELLQRCAVSCAAQTQQICASQYQTCTASCK